MVLLDNGRSSILATQDGAADAALHSLRGVHERLPGVPADGRACVRVGVSGADRRDSDAATDRDETCAVAAVRFFAVRRVLRSVPGQDQHPRDPDRSACAGDGPGAANSAASFFDPMYLGMRVANLCFRGAWLFHTAQWMGRIGRGSLRVKMAGFTRCQAWGRSGRRRAILRGLPKQTFHEWWKKTGSKEKGTREREKQGNGGEMSAITDSRRQVLSRHSCRYADADSAATVKEATDGYSAIHASISAKAQ